MFGHAGTLQRRTTTRIALINPNTNAATTAAMVALAQAEAAGAFVVGGVTAAFGAPVIVDEAALAVGAQAVSQAAAGWAHGARRPDAAIVAAFGDPGLDAVERVLPGRAVGIGAAGLAEAAAGGRRFAVATTMPGLAAAIGGGPLAVAARALKPRFVVEIVEPVPAAARAVARMLAGGGG